MSIQSSAFLNLIALIRYFQSISFCIASVSYNSFLKPGFVFESASNIIGVNA